MSSSVIRLMFLGITTLGTMPALAQTVSTPGTPPIHHFPLDGNVVDVVGGALLLSSAGITEADGYVGKAIHFDGSAYVEIAVDIAPLALPAFTIVALVKPDLLPEDAEALGDVYPTGYIFSDGDGLVYLGDQQKRMPFFAAQSTGAAISNSVHPGMRNGWQLVAITRSIKSLPTDDGDADHNQIMLYTNGRVSEDVRVNNNLLVLPVLRLGTINPGSSSTFHGAIDHLSIYDYAMSKEELDNMRVALRQSYAPLAGGSTGVGSAAGDGGADIYSPFAGTVIDAPDLMEDAPGAGGGPEIGGGDVEPYSPFAGAGTVIDAPDLMEDAPGSAYFNGDWGIVEVSISTPAGRDHFYPGESFSVHVSIRKSDPSNQFPAARARMIFGGEWRFKTFSFDSDPVNATKQFQWTQDFQLPVGADAFGPMWTGINDVAVSLHDPNGLPSVLNDRISVNNQKTLSFTVKLRPRAEDEGDEEAQQGQYSYPDIGIHSEISGSAGEKVVSLSFFNRQDVVTYVRVREKFDRPCEILAVSNGSGRSHAECTFRSPTAPDPGYGANPITALQVCHSYLNDRVKGLRVWRQSLDADGKFAPYRNYEIARADELFDRANCSSWREKAMCERDKVATGLRAHFNGNGAVVGLQLMCTRVDPT